MPRRNPHGAQSARDDAAIDPIAVRELLAVGAERAQVTVKSIIENLKRIAKKAEDLGDARGLQAARASWADIARISGLVVERCEVGDPGEFARMTDEELNAALTAQAKALGLPQEAIDVLLLNPSDKTKH